MHGLDKFPPMTDYVIPSGVRIADATRVRLGAHLAEGTVVMHEGYCNFNAGTLGTAMVEGRISQGVIVGDGSDIGGGASIMGTLSGGGTEQVTIGERCLVGANAGIGISLGDDCVVEAGLYVTAGHAGPAARRRGRQGPRAVRRQRDDVHPPQPDRRRRGPPAPGHLGRPQRRPALSRWPRSLRRLRSLGWAGQGRPGLSDSLRHERSGTSSAERWPWVASRGMTDTVDAPAAPDLSAAADVVGLVDDVIATAVRRLAERGGPDADQVVAYDLAHAASAAATARSLLDYGAKGDVEARLTCAFVADTVHDVMGRLAGREQRWGVDADPLRDAHGFLERVPRSRVRRRAGRSAGPTPPRRRHGAGPGHLPLVRRQRRRPARRARPPHNADVPEDIVAGLAEIGAFGLSVPAEYGGYSEGGDGEYLAMVVATEELSRASLGIGGSLITRPEILTRALVKGGTEAQKQHWLPKLATAEVMAAVAVTEPDYGSDVAGLKVTATPADGADGRAGYVINGVKTWCTFGARADVLMLLARTDPDRSKTHRGLSLFIVPKPRADGHGFELDAGRTARPARSASSRVGRSTPSGIAGCTATRSRSRTGGCPPTT